MSRARKTFISDAYAERQARFASLPIAKIEHPLRVAARRVVAAVFPLRGEPSVDQVITARNMLRPIVRMAKRGDGAQVQALARRIVSA